MCFRNNLIKVIENFEPLADILVDLDLYDNQITKVSCSFAALTSLLYLTYVFVPATSNYIIAD